jgi:hypothetical protein
MAAKLTAAQLRAITSTPPVLAMSLVEIFDVNGDHYRLVSYSASMPGEIDAEGKPKATGTATLNLFIERVANANGKPTRSTE